MEKKNIYNRIVTSILIFFICLLVLLSFIFSENHFLITREIILCLVILVVLCLAELFDYLSIPKVLSLSKNVKDVKRENDDLKNTNLKLIEQLVNIKNTNNQIMYLPGSVTTVGSSNIEEVEKKKSEDSENTENESINENVNINGYRTDINERLTYRRNLEIFLLKKLFNKKSDECDIQYEVKVINNKPLQDNIMKNETRFDAMQLFGKNCVFYEVKSRPDHMAFIYELHYKLRLVQLYGEANSCSSKLVLVLPKLDLLLQEKLDMYNRFSVLKERVIHRFEPAIDNGLLEIIEIDVSKEEMDKYIENKDK